MKAMVLAAGLGTRLRPLTDNRPKALVEVAGRTLLEIVLSRLRSFGVSEVIVNVHHFADMVIDYLKANNHFGMRIEVSREDVLLDTGGGLKKAAWFFLEDSREAASSHPAKNKSSSVIPSEARNPGKMPTRSINDQTPRASASPDEPFLLHNVDVISTIDFRRMLQFHSEHRALATLAVQSRESSRLLLFNDHLQLCGRRISGKDTVIPLSRDVIPAEARDQRTVSPSVKKGPSTIMPGEDDERPTRRTSPESAFSSNSALATRHSSLLEPLAFSGIHAISPRLLSMLTEEGVFSIIDSYVRLASQGENILAFRADEYYWRDLGRPADLSQASLDLQQNALRGSEL